MKKLSWRTQLSHHPVLWHHDRHNWSILVMSRISTRAMFTYSRFEIPLFPVVLCCSTNILLFSLSATTGLILFYDQASLTYYCSRNKVTFWPKGTQPYCPLNTAYVSYNNDQSVFHIRWVLLSPPSNKVYKLHVLSQVGFLSNSGIVCQSVHILILVLVPSQELSTTRKPLPDRGSSPEKLLELHW